MLGDTGRSMLEITFSGGSLRCPETPEYLEVALHLLQVLREQARKSRGAGEGDVVSPPTVAAPSPPPVSPAPPAPRPTAPGSRVRWFVTHRPRIQTGPGQVVEPKSLEELKGFLQARGLTPHPRGDASMLLWQVRERLGLPVEAVPLEGSTGPP
ncbi:hypothetical protein HRbin23_01270 [bacterium HR23]|nr:hypothetical protein HRbin23_01270 [bacterium HR23]